MSRTVPQKRAAVEAWLSYLRARRMPDDSARQELNVLLALYYQAWERLANWEFSEEDKTRICDAYTSVLAFLNRHWLRIVDANGGPDGTVEEFYEI